MLIVCLLFTLVVFSLISYRWPLFRLSVCSTCSDHNTADKSKSNYRWIGCQTFSHAASPTKLFMRAYRRHACVRLVDAVHNLEAKVWTFYPPSHWPGTSQIVRLSQSICNHFMANSNCDYTGNSLSSAQCCALLRLRVATTLAHSHIPHP